MESLAARTAHTVSRSCSSALAETFRTVGLGSFSSVVLQYRSDAKEGLDGRFPEASSAAHPAGDTFLSGESPPAVRRAQQTCGPESPVCFRNAHPGRKGLGLRDGLPIEILNCPVRFRNAHQWRKGLGFRVGLPIAILKPQQILSSVGNCRPAFSIVAQESCHVSPKPGCVLGTELLPIGSACRGGNAQVRNAIALLKQRQQQGSTVIDSYTFAEVLKLCLNQNDLIATRQVHACIVQSGMDKHTHVANMLLNVYVRCGRLQEAHRVFDGLEKKDKFTWSILIGGYAKSNQAEKALLVFNQMRQAGAQPGEPLCVSILNACGSPLALKWGQEVHAYIRHAGLEAAPRVGTALGQMYARCGCITEARRVFDKLASRDVITWNAMIGAYAKSGLGVEAHGLFLQMQREGFLPNAITYLSILNASASGAGALEWVRAVHREALKAGLESDVRVGNAFVHMYAKSGSIGDARMVFDRLKARDARTWTIMIGAHAESGCGAEAYGLFLQMQKEGFRPDAITFVSILNAASSAGALGWVKEVHGHACRAHLDSDLRVGSALVHMYAKSGSIGDAKEVFDRLKTRDVRTWNIMIGAYAESRRGVEAYGLFLQMKQEGFTPDAYTYTSILNASASVGALEWVREVHRHALEAGLASELHVANTLVHMYAKCGSLEDARLVFDTLQKRDVFTWNAMLGGLAQHGQGREALELFRRMNADGVKPDETSFMVVLSACCHAGLVDDGKKFFSAMTDDYGIEPTVVHYTCMVDLLGRAGQLEKAKLFIDDMPVEPNGVTWKALLGACRTYGNVELGELAAEEVLRLEPMDAAAYVVLSNIYAAAGKREKVWAVRKMMQERGVSKEPGCSWIEVGNKIHEFVVGDTSHPEAKAIYTVLKELTEKLKAEGYIPDTKVVLKDIHEEEKELALCSHSEKLAIAYGLLHIPPGQPVRVYKNLRVCSDCHTATKFISKVTGREVVARDANRFHHFKDGVCSCGDYW